MFSNLNPHPVMATIHAPDDVRKQSPPIIKLFTATPELKVKVGEVTYNAAAITALDAEVGTAEKAVADKRAELTPLLNVRNDKAGLLNTVLVQSRKAVSAYYGEDSTEYELVGGTRKSDRKSPGRRMPKAKPDDAAK